MISGLRDEGSIRVCRFSASNQYMCGETAFPLPVRLAQPAPGRIEETIQPLRERVRPMTVLVTELAPTWCPSAEVTVW